VQELPTGQSQDILQLPAFGEVEDRDFDLTQPDSDETD
jgi:hypothetical protein